MTVPRRFKYTQNYYDEIIENEYTLKSRAQFNNSKHEIFGRIFLLPISLQREIYRQTIWISGIQRFEHHHTAGPWHRPLYEKFAAYFRIRPFNLPSLSQLGISSAINNAAVNTMPLPIPRR
jgi:hypothetical protein